LFIAIDIHGETFLGIAFSRRYDVEKWRVSRSSARAFLRNVLEIDIQSVTATIMRLCKLLSQVQTGRPVAGDISKLSVRQQMWKKLYPAIQTNDADGIAIIIAIVAQTAHVDMLYTKPFTNAFKVSNAADTLNEVNRSLATIREGFIGAMTNYADVNTSSLALDVLRRPGVVQDTMKLMLSPVEEMQLAAQNLVELAFDVDARHDCFRALLENLPDAGLEGIFDFLTTFIDYAPRLPEACSLSKSLVRCFTDIIDVLCTTPNGLLHSQHFLKSADDKGPAAQLPKLWNLMSRSLTVIFRRTPLWSTYFDNEDMIVWMRDALIFGRDMLATWRVVESAANSRSTAVQTTSKKLSNIGRKMIGDLQDVLQELARWLRLTDEELLHQSFSLLKSLLECFREAGVTPSEDSLKKLRKQIDSARNDDSRTRIRLDRSRLLTLEAALDEFDEVVVVSGPALSVKDTAKARSIQDSTEKAKLTSKSLPKPITDLPTSRSKSRFFTDEDQQKLDAAVSLPSFRRADKPFGVKPGTSTSAQPTHAGPKNEALAKPTPSDSSSSSESDSEEEGANEGLAVLAKLQRSPKIRKMAERRQVKTLDIPTHKNPMQERLKRKNEARNAALRLNPDISNLHKALLSWDYEHTGSEPPGDKPKLTQIPDKFANFEEYKAVFEPLLLMECWAQILQAKEEVQDSFECQINSRQFLDSWVDLDISFLGSVKKDWYLAETDVVLLKHPNAKKWLMAKTRSYRSTLQGSQASLRCYIRPGNIDPGLQISTKWQLSKLFR
jgi:senataxin